MFDNYQFYALFAFASTIFGGLLFVNLPSERGSSYEKNWYEEETKSEEIDYSTMKVAELKELLKKKDLPVSGTKAELIERLQA